MVNANADMLFEASWEVCNKVGGIYTVVVSKAALMKEYYKNYFLIGPYFEQNAEIELKKTKVPKELQVIFDALEEEGIVCHYGKWQIKSEPNVILIDFEKLWVIKDTIKAKLWEDYKIDSLKSGHEFEEPVLWSWAIGMLLDKVGEVHKNKKIVAHFHEWMAGASLLFLKSNKSNVKTVFTTHATMLGRSMCCNGKNLYDLLPVLDPEKEAYELNVQDKFHVERACAQNAQVFTTVSEITAIEAEKILGRKADVLVLNGLDVEKFPTTEETSIKHVTCREKIREHLTYHFFPHYTFDLTHNLIFFVFGRYEFKNKGLDILIKALAILNTRLKTEKRNRTIAVFFWIPQQTHSVKIELLENKNYYRHIKNFVEWNSPHILKRIVEDFVSQRDLSSETLFSKEFLIELKKDILKFKRQGNPLILTHEINNENNDPIITALKAEGLDNKEEDKVKAILYPVYLTGNDSLINLSYYDAMAGGHLGIFPSYYEPWGYTPLETSAIGVPAITTDLAGFGRFIEKERGNVEGGIFVLKRYQQKEDLIVADLADIMYKFAMLSHNDRVRNKIMAKNLSNLADWQGLIKNYVLAHNLALKR